MPDDRCEHTGHPCLTDTVPERLTCDCTPCLRALLRLREKGVWVDGRCPTCGCDTGCVCYEGCLDCDHIPGDPKTRGLKE